MKDGFVEFLFIGVSNDEVAKVSRDLEGGFIVAYPLSEKLNILYGFYQSPSPIFDIKTPGFFTREIEGSFAVIGGQFMTRTQARAYDVCWKTESAFWDYKTLAERTATETGIMVATKNASFDVFEGIHGPVFYIQT